MLHAAEGASKQLTSISQKLFVACRDRISSQSPRTKTPAAAELGWGERVETEQEGGARKRAREGGKEGKAAGERGEREGIGAESARYGISRSV